MSEKIDAISRANLMAYAEMASREELANFLNDVETLIIGNRSEVNASKTKNYHFGEYKFHLKTENVSASKTGWYGWETHIVINLGIGRTTIEGKDGGIKLDVPEALSIHHRNLLQQGQLKLSHLVDMKHLPDVRIVEILVLFETAIYRPKSLRLRSWNAAMKEAQKLTLEDDARKISER